MIIKYFFIKSLTVNKVLFILNIIQTLKNLLLLQGSKKLSLWLLIFLILFALLHFFKGFTGYYFYDDITYARFAYYLQNGNFRVNEDIFSHRWGIIAPTAFFYKIGGINDCTARLLPLLSYLGILGLLYSFFRDEKYLPFILIFTGLDFYTLFFSEKLYPDLPLAFYSLAALLILFHKTDKLWSPIVFVLLNFAAFLCKMTIVYLLPFYLLIFIQDIPKKHFQKFWIQSLSWGSLLLFLYFGFYYWQIGNPFERWQTIQEGHYESSLSYYDKPFQQVLTRLTYQPFLMLIASSMAISFVFALPSFLRINFRDIRKTPESFFGVAALGIFLMFWFFTTSFHYYSPMGLQARHLLLAMPILGILAGFSLKSLSQKDILLIIFSFAFCSFYSFQIQNQIVWIYLFLALLVLSQVWLPKVVFGFLLFIILLIHPTYSLWKANTQNYQAEKTAFAYLKQKESSYPLFVDNRMLNGGDYFFKFEKPETIEFISMEKIDSFSFQSNHNYFLLINTQDIQYHENWNRENLDKDWELIWTDHLNIFLYHRKP